MNMNETMRYNREAAIRHEERERAARIVEEHRPGGQWTRCRCGYHAEAWSTCTDHLIFLIRGKTP